MFPFFADLVITPPPQTFPGISGDIDYVALATSPLAQIAYVVIGAFFGIYVLLHVIRHFTRKQFESSLEFKKDVLLVLVPKEQAEKGEAGSQEKTLEQIREKIAVMESIFTAIGNMKVDRSLKEWFTGRDDAVSFEIVAHEGTVSFYVVTPRYLKEFLVQQIQAQYPSAQVDEVPDYNIFSPTGVAVGCRLKFKQKHFYQIRTFKKLETDPLNAITNALSKIDKEDGGAVQVIVRSAKREWRSSATKFVRAVQGGKAPSEALNTKSLGSEVLEAILVEPKKKEPGSEAPKRIVSPQEESMLKDIEEKASHLGLDVCIRVVASSKTALRAEGYMTNLLGAFAQFNIPQYGNQFVKMSEKPKKLIHEFTFRRFDPLPRIVLTGDELASIFHFPLSSTETPNIEWLTARKSPPPQNLPETGVVLGHILYRGQDTVVRIKPADRRRHMYIIGKSGSGKTELQKAIVKQDIEEGRGVCVIDPHGDFADDCLSFVPKHRADDVIYFNPGDVSRPMGMNLMEYNPKYPEQKTFAVNEMLKIFDKLYDLKATGGPMFEQYMRNAMILCMDHPESGSTLMEIPRVLSDEKFRKFKLKHCTTQVVKDFWEKEAQKAGGEASLANMVPYITSKLTPFIANDFMRPIIGQQESAFNFREIMDSQKIMLVGLSKGKIGDLNAYLLGMVIIGKILMAALSRTDMDPKARNDFYLYIDEFQNFLTDSIVTILSEARKYGLCLTMAHQFIGQLSKGNDTMIRDAVFGNVGSMMVYRVGMEDAQFLEKEFAPVFSAFDLVNVEAYTANAKILIDNTASRPFNLATYYAKPNPNKEMMEAMKQLSRLKYGRDRELIEEDILERTRTAIPDDEDEDEE